jgi:hypothetical protein
MRHAEVMTMAYVVELMAAVVVDLVLMSGCLDLKPNADSVRPTETSLLGVWIGVTMNDCSPVQAAPVRCRAVERIGLTLLRQQRTSWGFYWRAPGNTPFSDRADRGQIRYLSLKGRVLWFRVMRDDHTSCLFDTVPQAGQMRGKFFGRGSDGK